MRRSERSCLDLLSLNGACQLQTARRNASKRGLPPQQQGHGRAAVKKQRLCQILQRHSDFRDQSKTPPAVYVLVQNHSQEPVGIDHACTMAWMERAAARQAVALVAVAVMGAASSCGAFAREGVHFERIVASNTVAMAKLELDHAWEVTSDRAGRAQYPDWSPQDTSAESAAC